MVDMIWHLVQPTGAGSFFEISITINPWVWLYCWSVCNFGISAASITSVYEYGALNQFIKSATGGPE